jgi:AAA+ ATPase superfamily predicted ATPase
MAMDKFRNPFVTGAYVSEEYFCDRVEETNKLVRILTNNNHAVLISPRRMGKTGLISHCFRQSKIQGNYHTFFLDIYSTASLREFIFCLGKQLFETLKPRGQKFIDHFFSVITSLRPAFKLDEITASPIFDIGLGEIKEPEFTLEEIFKFIQTAEKPCIVAIDEFQQISKYPEKNVEALLRTHIQHCTNGIFIFAGSQHQMMQNMFFSNSRPFYQSANLLFLDVIDIDIYIPFVIKHFNAHDKWITAEDIQVIYHLFEGHTWYLQSIFNELFSLTERNEICNLSLIQYAIKSRIESYQPLFQGTLSLLPERQKEVLYAIAKEGKAQNITSAEFIKKHSLLSASSVQAAIKQLTEKEIITENNKIYQIYDRFFYLWLTENYGAGYHL